MYLFVSFWRYIHFYLAGYMLKQGTVTLSSLTLLLGLLVLCHLSASLMADEQSISSGKTLICGTIQGENLATKEVAPSGQTALISLHRQCNYQQPDNSIFQLKGEIHESQNSNVTQTVVIFCLLFLSAGLPCYGQRKYRTPKSILESSSLLMSWIKPIKGMPS
ncbi:hypothetical protein SHAQ108633_10970 [Shewanella aquimarina]